jgi:RimJ/RimL family protein N-acetyltransferase
MDVAIPVKPALATARLELRPFAADDIDDLHSMDGDARVMRFLGNGLPPRSRAECEAALARMRAAYDERPGFGLLHGSRRDDGAFVGGCGLFGVPDDDQIEIAYRLPVSQWGRGYATEMARAVLAHGFGTLKLVRVIGLTWPENVASQRVLEHIGMVREGSGRYYGREMFRYAAAAP